MTIFSLFNNINKHSATNIIVRHKKVRKIELVPFLHRELTKYQRTIFFQR